ncbi:MAG TPA: hypothetical protein ENH38_05580 [Nitrospirae bacterium]|nr:hypothetical protein [Nitrospirota bacterium]HDO23424.1 hypothetical protein [Nitrospirota bacterium]HDZ88072.1 hypothetical protein [Nitrospirota bacterium]
MRDNSISRTLGGYYGGTHDLEGFNEKVAKLRSIDDIEIKGDISVHGGNRDFRGSFIMSVKGEDMDMNISSKGITAGSIHLKGGNIEMTPSLGDEYVEYMFAVILRDALVWWNIYGYDTVITGSNYVIRNSWKKIYVNPVFLLPEKQIVRMTRHREVEISYADVRDYGFSMLSSKVKFEYNRYKCNLSITDIEVGKVSKSVKVRDP